MTQATLQEEKKLWKKGYNKVCCLDEAGRGPLAGPVTAAAVVYRLPMSVKFTDIGSLSAFSGIRDSKKLSPKKRERFYKILTNHPAIKWGIGIVSEKIIDKINILEATKLAMKKALEKLKADYLILDGKMELDLPISQKSIVKADEKVFSCAAASIIAKVTRDRIMARYHKKYPQYGFDRHRGYPTKHHYQMIRKYGPCQIHRKSFNIQIYGRSTKTT